MRMETRDVTDLTFSYYITPQIYLACFYLFVLFHLDELHVYSYSNSGLYIPTDWRGLHV